ncbi:MAG: hypothetical protein EOP56_10400 [Sphingobacteriales bacterium]|nr:MAG: hypothetical protein EOP56_10400 [Sphingobacteriales bacterium]
MRTEILNLDLVDKRLMPAKSELSFKPFISYLENLIRDQPLKKAMFETMIVKFKSDLSGREHVKIEEAAVFKDLLELVYILLNPLITHAAKHVWALSTPVPGEIFYSTDAFYNFHTSENFSVLAGDFETKNILSGKEKGFIYQLILRRFYNIDFSVCSDSHIQGLNPKTRNPVFYKIEIDTRFLEVSYTEQLPDLDIALVESWLLDSKGEKYLETLLPLSNFQIRGFSILQFTDVTEEHAIEKLQNIIEDHEKDVLAEGINETLQSLAGSRNLRFGILPFIKLNSRAIYLDESSTNSLLMAAALKYRVKQDVYNSLIEQYEKHPEVRVHNNISINIFGAQPLQRILKNAGIESFALLPVVYLKKVVGVLEVYSNEKVFIDQKLLSRLQAAIPYIGLLFKHISEEFADSIEQAVRDDYTSIKSSVKWKFNEVVWAHSKKSRDISTVKIGKVSFDKLYPFYGAVDIRQSSMERNNAVLEDITLQIKMLEQVLKVLPSILDYPFTVVMAMNEQKWLNCFEAYEATGDEITFNQLVQEEIEPFLLQAAEASIEIEELVRPYLNSVLEADGIVHKNRRELERSRQMVNSSINRYLTHHQKELQKIFPHYFDRFRTDGVEYDIYLGQSIAPHKIFTMEHVKHMRLWQLKSMAEIGLIIRNLQPQLSKPLQTTQLIFVHSSPISISYRNDEKRFDVEGAYSVRYEIIKKRIDKISLKNKDERLTQPDKIALVYLSQSEEEEYMEYISVLQREGFLKDDVEFLELEELQGVYGMKAIRVGIG